MTIPFNIHSDISPSKHRYIQLKCLCVPRWWPDSSRHPALWSTGTLRLSELQTTPHKTTFPQCNVEKTTTLICQTSGAKGLTNQEAVLRICKSGTAPVGRLHSSLCISRCISLSALLHSQTSCRGREPWGNQEQKMSVWYHHMTHGFVTVPLTKPPIHIFGREIPDSDMIMYTFYKGYVPLSCDEVTMPKD